MQEFKKEIAILKACRDPNVVAFLVGVGRPSGGGGCSSGHDWACCLQAAVPPLR